MTFAGTSHRCKTRSLYDGRRVLCLSFLVTMRPPPLVCPRDDWYPRRGRRGGGFYRAMLSIRGTSHGPVSVRLSVCLSVSRCSIETDERIELVFGMLASFHPSYTVLKGNSVVLKNRGTSLGNFALKSGLRKFRHGISIVDVLST